MARQLSVYTKIAYINALKSGVSVHELSTITGISRTTMYQWRDMYSQLSESTRKSDRQIRKKKKHNKHRAKATIAAIQKLAVMHPEFSLDKLAQTAGKSKTFIWKILKEADLSTKMKREAYKNTYYRHLYRHVDMDIYKSMKEEIKNGMSVMAVCKKYGISRTTFYNLKNSHKKKKNDKQYYRGEDHYRFIRTGEEVVLSIAIDNPDFSLREIVNEVKSQLGAGSVFYVYTILKPHRLTTKHARISYRDSQSGFITSHEQVLDISMLKQFVRGLFLPLALGSVLVVIAVPGLSRDGERLDHNDASGVLTKTPKAQTILASPIENASKQDLSWGVLAVNMEKSLYQPGEDVKMGFSVLDEKGMGQCFTGIKVQVTDPEGRVTEYSTKDNSITLSTSCGAATVTNNPDYYLTYPVKQEGKHTVSIDATSRNGHHTAASSFAAAEGAPFIIERSAATRVWPWELYTMKVKVRAEKAFSGNIIEQVPDDFIVYADDANLNNADNGKSVSWQTSMKAGEVKEFTYTFDAADVSPAFYTLGQLEIHDSAGKLLLREPHAWQLAIDGL